MMMICYCYLMIFLSIFLNLNKIDTSSITVNNNNNLNSKQQIIQLNSINLTEEFNYTNEFLFNFKKYLPSNLANMRLQILPSISTNYQLVDALFVSSSSFGNNQIANMFTIDSKFNLFANGIFDREFLIESNQCETNSDLFECTIKLKIASYDDQNNLITIFNLPIYLIDINDCKPVFKSSAYSVNISENLSSRTVLPLEAPTDLDSPQFSIQNCFIESNNFTNLFELNFNIVYKNLYLIVNWALDRENKSEYHLVLTCSDGKSQSNTDLIVNVLDANDNIPYFKQDQYNLTINENEQIDSLVQIRAFDLDDQNGPNGQLIYTLPLELNSFEICNELFLINESTGLISTRKPLDYEKSKKYSLKVKVQDKGANPVPIYTNVFINVLDMNDNAPIAHLSYVDKYIAKENRSNNTIWINEEIYNQQSISLAYMTLTDSDSPALNGYSLSAELISVSYLNSTSLQVNYESDLTFRLVPIIQEYNNIYYGLHLVKQVNREEKLYYDIQIRLFDNSGKIINKEQDKQESYFNLRVILLDINDNKPKFIETSSNKDFEFYKFYVNENQLKLNFANVQAIDFDIGANSDLEYRILDENNLDLLNKYLKLENKKNLDDDLNPNYLFYINSDNGSISLRAELDREQREYYLFTVRATDKPLNSSASLHTDILVEINLIDDNDNQPIYQMSNVQFSLNENTPINTVIGSVKAYDPDLNPKTDYLIEPSEMNKYFYVDQDTGSLLTKNLLDAEDTSLNKVLINNTFNLKILAKDSELLTYGSLPKLNVSIYLNDLNDNQPEIIYPFKLADKLVKFDLNDYKYSNDCSTASTPNQIYLKSIQIIDKDRDTKNNQNHLYKFGFIRRLSWQFVNEIVKSQLYSMNSQLNNNNKTIDSNDSQTILEFIENIINVQQMYDLKPISKVNLRSVFSLTPNASRNYANLNIAQICRLNWGVYNFSLQVNDQNQTLNTKSDLSVKLFAFSSFYMTNETNLTQSQLELLNNLIEIWWSQNYNLVANYKKRLDQAAQSSQQSANSSVSNKNNADDNGDDIDGITQEYYKLYAASPFSRFSSNSKNNSLLNIANMFLFNKTSNSIILLISIFALISIGLICIITYKHYKASVMKRTNFKKHLNIHKNTLLNVNQLNLSGSDKKDDSTDCSNSSINISDLISERKCQDKQSTKDLSSSPRLAASKFKNMSLKTSSSSSNLVLYPSQQQQQQNSNLISSGLANNNNNPNCNNNEQSTRNTQHQQQGLKCSDQLNQSNNNSICDSFTVITSIAAADCSSLAISANPTTRTHYNRNTITAISETSSESSVNQITGTTAVLIANTTSTPTIMLEQPTTTYLSTFVPKQSSEYSNKTSCSTQDDQSCMVTTLVNDMGYYGSSDYSENNSFGIMSQKQLKPNQPPRALNSNSQQSGGTNSSSSFTSSSLLSSPSSSTDSSTTTTPTYLNSNQPVITNLYPINVYQQTTNKQIEPNTNVNNSVKSKNADVKIYLERFERIYNSDTLNSNLSNDLTSSCQKTLNTFNSTNNSCNTINKQRNSVTTYSYV